MDTNPEKVASVNSQQKTSAINVSEKDRQSGVCYWNGASYSVGAIVCDNGSSLRCDSDGTWSYAGQC